MEILAYFEEWSRRPGDKVRLAVSTKKSTVRTVLERILTGPGAKGESRVGTQERADVLDVTFPGRWQETAVGSYALFPLSGAAMPTLSIHCWIWPTVPDRKAPQTVWALPDAGLSLAIVDGALELRAGSATVIRNSATLIPRNWYSVVMVLGRDQSILNVEQTNGRIAQTRLIATGPAVSPPAAKTFYLAGNGVDSTRSPVTPYNGKVDLPTLYRRALTDQDIRTIRSGGTIPADIAWDFGRDFMSEVVAGAGGAKSGKLYNGVERAVTGHNWDGHSDSFIETPEQYQALQFHEDDMVDSNWNYDVEFDLPTDLASGIYCVRLEADGSVERCTLFVLGAREEKADVLFLIPTNTYLAYANEQLAKLDFSSVMAHVQKPHPDDVYLAEHSALGRSCYDTHSDGTVCRYSSRRRPIIQMRPGYPNWLTNSYRHFPVDLYFIEWLDKLDHSYHVATDEELELEGRELLDKYKVIVTGSHPEYWTRDGRNILDSYLRNGGRLMYLGGNGFYWVTSRDPTRPWLIEVRRDNSGTRCWDAPAGERGHVYTREQGGIWKNRGMGPHGFVGVGFCAEGWSKGCGYRRRPESYEGVGSLIFKGVEDEIVGDFGYILDGAVGDEIDRFDTALGSPPHAVHLATSTGVGKEYIHVVEEQIAGMPDQGGDALPDLVRSDIVYFPIEGGGAVFSIGSITVVSSMAWNGFDNNMARVVENALDVLVGELPCSDPLESV